MRQFPRSRQARRYRRAAGWSAAAAVLLLAMTLPAGAQPQPDSRLVLVHLVDAIHPISAEFVIGSVAEAERLRADVLVLQIDTPGGLDSSMRQIIQAFLSSSVPVCLWVAPSGARAASAGFFMAMAADVVAMAESTNMGAASPVPVAGGVDETMRHKLIEDAQAYIRSLAAQHSRPPELAAEAVGKGRSFSADEAVQAGLADFIASDLDALVQGLQGRSVRKGQRTTVLHLDSPDVVELHMSWRQRVLSALATPNVAYVLMLIGIAGLYFEFSTPGAVLPGVLGGVCLVLALLAFQVLPISFAGLALIGLAVLFFILEIKVTSYGLLTVAGLVAFVLGSLMLVPGPIPEMRLHLAFVLPTAGGVVAIAAFLLWLVLRTHRGPVHTGPAGLVGEHGKAMADLAAGEVGQVFVHGELWRARADEPVRAGDPVQVLEIGPGMVVRVRPIADSSRRSSPEKGV